MRFSRNPSVCRGETSFRQIKILSTAFACQVGERDDEAISACEEVSSGGTR
jgi:hypothetical protein